MDDERDFGSVAPGEEPVIVVSIDDAPEDTVTIPDVGFPDVSTANETDHNTALEEKTFTILFNALSGMLESIEQEQASITKGMENLQNAFDSKIKYDGSKDKIIDSLHTELQTYRDDLVFKILRPVITDLIDMHRDINSMLGYEKKTDGETVPTTRLLNTLESFQSTIVEILARNEVEAFSEPGESFVPKRQRSIRVLETDDPAKDGTIADRLRCGFIYEDRLIAHEQVAVYRYQPGSIVGQPKGDS